MRARSILPLAAIALAVAMMEKAQSFSIDPGTGTSPASTVCYGSSNDCQDEAVAPLVDADPSRSISPNAGRFRERGGQGKVHNGYCPEVGRFRPHRSGLPNNSRRDYLQEIADDGLAVWPISRMPVRVYISNGAGVPGYRASYYAVMIDSFNEWASASDGRITFQQVRYPQQADITVWWVPRFDSARKSSEVGNTTTLIRSDGYSRVSIIEKAHIRMLTLFRGHSFSDEELKKVSLHEIGHAVGLQGHSPDPRDIMHGTTSPGQRPVLSLRDVATFIKLNDAAIASNP